MSKDNPNMALTVFLLAMISVGWGVAFLSLAILLEKMAPMQVLAARWTITSLLFLILIAMGRIKLKIRGRNAAFLFMAGLFEPCAYSILEAYGIKLTSASTSAIFVASIPAMTMILGVLFFRKKADFGLIICLLMSFGGVVLATFLSPDFSMSGTRAGMICMTFGVFAASLYSLSSQKASEDFNAGSITAIMAFEGAVLFNIIAFAQGHGLDTFTLPFSSGLTAAHMLFLSLFCAFGSYFCYNKILNYVEAALASNITGSLSTIIGVTCGVVFMGDLWGWYTILGMGITLVGVWLTSRRMQG